MTSYGNVDCIMWTICFLCEEIDLSVVCIKWTTLLFVNKLLLNMDCIMWIILLFVEKLMLSMDCTMLDNCQNNVYLVCFLVDYLRIHYANLACLSQSYIYIYKI